ncbi:MAG: ABC transporter permease [Candidatus Bathyarchaeia archaeon]
MQVPHFILPTPVQIAQAFFTPSIDWLRNTWVTFSEALAGFATGTIVGVGLAVVIVESKLLRRLLTPYIVTAQVLPKVAVAPIIYIILGFNDVSRIFLVFLLVFFPILINMATGLTDVDTNLIHLLKSLGAGELTVFLKVRLPNSLPYLFDGLKISATGAMVGAIVAEFVSSSAGLGFIILNSQYTFNTSLAFASFIILIVVGLFLYEVVELSGRLAMPWFQRR